MLLHKNDLYKIAKARLKNNDDVYDAIQETMLIAFKKIKKLNEPLSFKSWLIKILISRSNNLYSKKNTKKIISLDEVENYRIEYSNLENSEAILDFNFICKNLKYEDRIIIILHYMEKFTDKEIGEILSLKENTVKTKGTRAIQQIKNIVKGGEKENG